MIPYLMLLDFSPACKPRASGDDPKIGITDYADNK